MSIQRSGISVTALLGLALAAIFSFSAYAEDGINVSSGLTLAGGPLALRGYDAVAYIADGQATRGTADHSTLHDGAGYRFASAKNKAAFEADPARYLRRTVASAPTVPRSAPSSTAIRKSLPWSMGAST